MCCGCASVSPEEVAWAGSGTGTQCAPECLVLGFLCFSFGLKSQGRPMCCKEGRCWAKWGAGCCTCGHPTATATLLLSHCGCHHPSVHHRGSLDRCPAVSPRGEGGREPEDPVLGPSPHRCPHPRVSTRPRGPQEVAVLCHGRWLLLTPAHRRLRGHPGCWGRRR